MSKGDAILCLNSGSSSLKFGLYRFDESTEVLLASGEADRIGLPNGRLKVRDSNRAVVHDEPYENSTRRDIIRSVFTALQSLRLPRPEAVGHRVVHGGWEHVRPERVTEALMTSLRALVPFAPLHLPSAIEEIDVVTEFSPDLPQVACFDTAFHRAMPEVAQRLPLPGRFWDEGVRRYGFHGSSYEYILGKLGSPKARLIIAHLGNGASLAAIRDGKPMDTTMGFSPTAGLMMGTRTGDLDPGVLLYLSSQGYDFEHLEKLVNHESGLLGVSGISSDMRTLGEAQAQKPAAALAIAMFSYQLRKHIGAMAAVLDGLDTLVFTGGIGEHMAELRSEVCNRLGFLGIEIDPERNAVHADTISTPKSRCVVRVIPTNEDLIIARHTHALTMAT